MGPKKKQLRTVSAPPIIHHIHLQEQQNPVYVDEEHTQTPQSPEQAATNPAAPGNGSRPCSNYCPPPPGFSANPGSPGYGSDYVPGYPGHHHKPESLSVIMHQPSRGLQPHPGAGYQYNTQEYPSNYLYSSILVCLCCNCPFGCVALICSISSHRSATMGDLQASRREAAYAFWFNFLGVIFSLILFAMGIFYCNTTSNCTPDVTIL